MRFILCVLLTTFSLPALAQIQANPVSHVWVQYSIIDGKQTATNSKRVSDADLLASGKGQIEYQGTDDPVAVSADVTKTPPTLIITTNTFINLN